MTYVLRLNDGDLLTLEKLNILESSAVICKVGNEDIASVGGFRL